MNNTGGNRLYSMLGICRKAGCVALGFDAVAEAIAKDRIRLLLLTKDISERSGEKISAAAYNGSVSVAKIPLSMDDIAALTGKRSGILGISDAGLADALMKLIV